MMRSIALMAAAVAAMDSVSPHITVRPFDASPKKKRTYRATAARQSPNGLTFKSLRRAFNSGWVPPEPTEQEKLRHLHPAHLRLPLHMRCP